MEQVSCLYRDEHLIAVHKPSGLLVHRSRLDAHARRFLVQILRDQIGQRVYPVHRLDKPTSGVMVFALAPDVARALTDAFTAQRVHKTYLAVVRGHPPEAGAIDRPLNKYHEPGSERRPARTMFRRLATTELPVAVSRYPTSRYALVEAQPLTGRTHQIRRHLNHIAHPVIGDGKHGDYRHNRYFREELGCDRLLLAAVRLELAHPVSGDPLRIGAPPEPSFQAVLDRFGWGSDTTSS